jgi:shikimate kinase
MARHADPIAAAVKTVEAPLSDPNAAAPDADAPHADTGPLRADWRQHPIVLVGLMGSGKTTVGKRLAARLHWPFVDADAEIEAAAAMPISDIFSRFGEPHFRDGERRVIARLMEGAPGSANPRVIATGGGAFVDPETRALILARGTAIWLDAAVDTLVARVARRGHRPLLVGKDPRVVLTDLLTQRAPAYAEAPIRVLSSPGPHEATVDAILAELKRRDPESFS